MSVVQYTVAHEHGWAVEEASGLVFPQEEGVKGCNHWSCGPIRPLLTSIMSYLGDSVPEAQHGNGEEHLLELSTYTMQLVW